MSTVETYLGGAQKPVGSIELMHSGFTAPSYTNRGQTWLRTGTLVPYNAAVHSQAAAAGLTVASWGGASGNVNPVSANFSSNAQIQIVNGQPGALVQGWPGDPGGTWFSYFSATGGVDPAPVFERYLPDGSAIKPAQTAYMPVFNGWLTYVYDTTIDQLMLWMTRDGVSWRRIANLPLPGIAATETAVYYILPVGDMLFVQYAQTASTNVHYGIARFDQFANLVGAAYTSAQGTTILNARITGPEGIVFTTAAGTVYVLRAPIMSQALDQGTLGSAANFVTNQLTSILTGGTEASMCFYYANGTYCILNGAGANTIHSGTSLQNITARTATSTGASWGRLGWSPGGYWVVSGSGTNNTVAVSADAVTWNSVATAADYSGQIALFNDVLCSTTGYVELATRVVTTRANAMSISGHIVTGGTNIVMLGADAIWTSTDGAKTWSQTYFGGATSNATSFLKYTGGRFFARMNTDLLQSSDGGLSWSVVTQPLGGAFADIEFFGGKWYVGAAASANLNYCYSTNLSTWTTGAIRTTTSNVLGFLTIGSTLHAFTSTGGAGSTDGINWTNSTGGLTGSFSSERVWYDGTTAIALTYASGQITRYASTDAGLNWTATAGTTIGTGYTTILGLVKFNGWYWTHAHQTVGNYQGFFRSADGISWSQVAMPIGSWQTTRAAVYNGNELIYVRSTGSVSLSQFIGVGVFFAENPPGGTYPLGIGVGVLDSTGAAQFVGTSDEVVVSNSIGYVRVA